MRINRPGRRGAIGEFRLGVQLGAAVAAARLRRISRQGRPDPAAVPPAAEPSARRPAGHGLRFDHVRRFTDRGKSLLISLDMFYLFRLFFCCFIPAGAKVRPAPPVTSGIDGSIVDGT